MTLLISHDQAEQNSADGNRDMNAIFTAKMLVPNTAVGGIIGKGGATISQLQAQCGAQMKVSSKDAQAMLGVMERVVSVTGDLRQMNIAVNLIVNTMQETPTAAQYENMTTQYGRRRMMHIPRGDAVFLETATSVTIGVMDSLAGFVVGKEGQTLREIQRQSGAKLVMSRRGEFIPGTTSRSVTISGPMMAVQNAQMMISQKIQMAAIKDVTGMARAGH